MNTFRIRYLPFTMMTKMIAVKIIFRPHFVDDILCGGEMAEEL